MEPTRARVNVVQASRIAGVSRRTIYGWLKAGTLEHARTPSGTIRIYVDALVASAAAAEGRRRAETSDLTIGRTAIDKKEEGGFASLTPEQRRAIASKAGKASHDQGKGHEWTSEEARHAGRKGGLAKWANAQRRRVDELLDDCAKAKAVAS